jgi:hypothetical protein
MKSSKRKTRIPAAKPKRQALPARADPAGADAAYRTIAEILQTARGAAYRAVNEVMVQAYWQIGRVIVEEEQRGKKRADYRRALIEELAQRLTVDFGKGFTPNNLWYMRQFYLTYPILHALRGELSWTHYRLLLKVESEQARSFYEIEAANNRWSTRELERQVGVLLYERLALSRDKKKVLELAAEGQIVREAEDLIKDPYVLEFLLIDLKTGKLTHQDIGQMDFYVRYFDQEEKAPGDGPVIGLILCSDKNEAMVRYTLLEDRNQIFASKYKLYLPTEEELQREIGAARARLEMERSLHGSAPESKKTRKRK